MRSVRFYCESIEPLSELDSVESNHLARVLRLSVGAHVELFDGKGTQAQAVVDQIQRNRVSLRITEQTQIQPLHCGRIVLAVSFAKGQRFDWLIEKCTELGADHIAAVQFERTVKLGKVSILNRLSKITIAAAKQSGRLFLPELSGPATLTETVHHLQNLYPQHTLVYGNPDGSPLSILNNSQSKKDVLVFIGPEGGFTNSEIAFFDELNATPICINKNILRVETAAVAFCSLLGQKQTV